MSDAIEYAINRCIDEDVLKDFLINRREEVAKLYIPLQMNHLHGLYEPASRRMRTTLTETAPTYYFVSFQVYT